MFSLCMLAHLLFPFSRLVLVCLFSSFTGRNMRIFLFYCHSRLDFDFGPPFPLIPFKQAGNSGNLWSHLVPTGPRLHWSLSWCRSLFWDSSKVQIPLSALKRLAVGLAGWEKAWVGLFDWIEVCLHTLCMAFGVYNPPPFCACVDFWSVVGWMNRTA